MDIPPGLVALRGLPWMTDATWRELCGKSWSKTHLEEISSFLRPDPTNGRQLVHAISHRLEKTVEQLLTLGASGDMQPYGPGEDGCFHPLDRAVGACVYPWSQRIAQMVFDAARLPFSMRPRRPLLACAIETPMAVAWCLGRGADPDQVSQMQYTALAAGALGSDKHADLLVVRRSMRLLLDAGARLDMLVPHPNADTGAPPCMTAAGCAIWANRWPLARLLLVRGADPDIGEPLSARVIAHRENHSTALRWFASRDAVRLNADTCGHSSSVLRPGRL